MLDVFQMRELTRARQKRAAEAGVELTDEQAYASDEEFEEAVAETEPPADGFGEGVVEEEEAALPTPQPLPKPVLGTLDPAQEAAPQRTLAQVEAELADIKRKGKKTTLADRRRRKLLQEEAEALKAQEAAPEPVEAIEEEAPQPPSEPQFARRRRQRRMRDYDPKYIRPIREKIPFTDLSGWSLVRAPGRGDSRRR